MRKKALCDILYFSMLLIGRKKKYKFNEVILLRFFGELRFKLFKRCVLKLTRVRNRNENDFFLFNFSSRSS